MNLEDNYLFSSFKGKDLQKLIILIENYMLVYRKTINLPKEITFGTEIEYERKLEIFVDSFVSKYFDNWDSKLDESILIGGEVASPILIDEERSWNELKKICEYLKKINAKANGTGGHIHIGADILKDDYISWRKFLKIFALYESVIYRFNYGDKLNGRKNIKFFSRPISDEIYDKIDYINKAQNIKELKCYLPNKNRNQSINFKNINFDDFSIKNKNTIEFRNPNGTLEEVIWQNNINMITKLILKSKEEIDEELLDYKLKNERISSRDYFMYNEINLNLSFEFVDLIFDNNLDKIYFLRQYLKNFEDVYGVKKVVYSKKFVR